MNPENIARALKIAFELLQAAQVAFAQASDMIQRARAEGRDVSDAELQQLTNDRKAALDKFARTVGE